MYLFFLSRAKRAEEEQQVKKVKMFSMTKNKISSDFLTSFVTYTCKCFINHTIIILFLLSEFLTIAFASTAWRRSSRARTRCERAKQTTGKYSIPKKYLKRQFHDVKAQRGSSKEEGWGYQFHFLCPAHSLHIPTIPMPPFLSRNNGERKAVHSLQYLHVYCLWS